MRILPESGLSSNLQRYATLEFHRGMGSYHSICVWLMVFPVSHKASRRPMPGPVLDSTAWSNYFNQIKKFLNFLFTIIANNNEG